MRIENKHYVQFKKENISVSDSGPKLLYGKIYLSIKTIQPFLVSDGVFWKGRLRFLRDTDGNIIIPGSSIKGAFRLYNEVFYDRKFVDKVFGSSGDMSKIMVNDVIIEKTRFMNIRKKNDFIFQQWGSNPEYLKNKEYNDTIRLYKCNDKDKAVRKIKVYIEPIRENEKIEVLIHFKDLSINDIKHFLTAVGANPKYPFSIKMGRGKNYEKGRVKIIFEKLIEGSASEISIDNWEISEKLKRAINNYKQALSC